MKNVCCIVVALVLLAASSALASSNVTNIELTWQNGQTVARIDVTGDVKFSHQTVVAKDGKPFRVIVDMLQARHNLGAKKFTELPACPVRAIRTSQYAVQPEEVVRVVFDMTKETPYQINTSAHSVTISFPDKGGQQFTAWSSAAVVAEQAKKTAPVTVAQTDVAKPTTTPAPSQAKSKSADEVNAAIDSDRMASLGSPASTAPAKKQTPAVTQPATATPTVKPPAEKKPPVTTASTTPEKKAAAPTAKASSPAPNSGFAESEKKVDWAEKPASTPPAKVTPKQTPAPEKKPAVADKPMAKATPESSVKPTAKPTAKPTSEPTPKAADKPMAKVDAKPAETKATPKAPSTPSKSTETKTVAQVDRPKDKTDGNVKPPKPQAQTVDESTKPAEVADATDDAKKKSTARFRRTPEQSRKIKGTMVAEFPKRLVVKYKARAYRDPFETLINETQVSNDPIEQRIPNVEGLRLVGIIDSDGGKNCALLEDANGYGYILRNGDRVKKGYVLRIESDKVYFQIFEYGWSRTIALHIED